MQHGERTLRALAKPFDRFLANPGTTNIVVNRPGEIGVECDGKWTWHMEPTLTFQRLDALAILAGFLMGKDCDESSPIVDTSLPEVEGGSMKCRLAMCRPYATEPGIVVLAIRHPPAHARSVDDPDFKGLFRRNAAARRAKGISPIDERLIELHRAAQDNPELWADFFKLAVKAKKTIGVVGETNSGKTDIVRRFLKLIPKDERIVTAEDTPEFGPMAQHNRASLFWGSDAVTPDDILKAFLRLRPDRPIMQELRGAEAYTFLNVIQTHSGGITTWHATLKNAFDRLAAMIMQSDDARGYSNAEAKLDAREAIPIIVHCDKPDWWSIEDVWFREEEDARATA